MRRQGVAFISVSGGTEGWTANIRMNGSNGWNCGQLCHQTLSAAIGEHFGSGLMDLL